jgi:hypothetical protein
VETIWKYFPLINPRNAWYAVIVKIAGRNRVFNGARTRKNAKKPNKNYQV